MNNATAARRCLNYRSFTFLLSLFSSLFSFFLFSQLTYRTKCRRRYHKWGDDIMAVEENSPKLSPVAFPPSSTAGGADFGLCSGSCRKSRRAQTRLCYYCVCRATLLETENDDPAGYKKAYTARALRVRRRCGRRAFQAAKWTTRARAWKRQPTS